MTEFPTLNKLTSIVALAVAIVNGQLETLGNANVVLVNTLNSL